MTSGIPGSVEFDSRELAAIFQLLSDPIRLDILHRLLTAGERNVGALCRDLKLPQPTISHHLSLLRSKNLVASRRQGKQIFYNVHACKSEKNSQRELSIRLSHSAIQVSFLDASASSLDNSAPCAI
jgi:ArsR family transcriptional regulator